MPTQARCVACCVLSGCILTVAETLITYSSVLRPESYDELIISYQLFHLAACTNEESLIEPQGCVDCSGVQLELSSFCVRFIQKRSEHNVLTTGSNRKYQMTVDG